MPSWTTSLDTVSTSPNPEPRIDIAALCINNARMSTEPVIHDEDEGQKQSLADRIIPDRLLPTGARLSDAPLIDELTDSLDRTRKLLSGDPEGAAAAAMNRFSGEKEVEARIALALSMNQPLADPERFLDAHRLAMRALEVLDREGFRRPSVPNLGPLTVVAEYLVENVTEYIVKSYAQGIIGSLRRLYARREVQTAPNSPERRLLASARNEIDRIVPDFTGGGIGAPVLVAGGLLLPFLASLSQYLGAVDVTDKVIQFGGIITAFVLFFILSGVLFAGRPSHTVAPSSSWARPSPRSGKRLGIAATRPKTIASPSLSAPSYSPSSSGWCCPLPPSQSTCSHSSHARGTTPPVGPPLSRHDGRVGQGMRLHGRGRGSIACAPATELGSRGPTSCTYPRTPGFCHASAEASLCSSYVRSKKLCGAPG